MTYRKPLPSDIGKSVEFSMDGEQWHTAKLSSIDYDEVGPLFWQNIEGKHRFFNHCRVPYSCPDPIAELSILADELAAAGHDEAARVLLDRVALLQQMHKMTDMGETATFTEYQSAYNQMRRQIMESLNIPKSLLTPNPEPQTL